MPTKTTETSDMKAPPFKLGKKAAKFDVRTLRMATYIEKRKLPRVPLSHVMSKKVLATLSPNGLGMMRNDDFGCCTIAALGHAYQGWTVYGKKPWWPSDVEILKAYNAINDGVDEGAAMLDALHHARRVGIHKNKIYAFVAIDPLNHDQVRTAAFLFGGLYVGANLPVTAQRQLSQGKAWELLTGNGSEPGSWGGHAMNVFDYSKKGLTVATWGQLQRLTWEWWDRYVDEAYAVLEEDYVGDDKRSPQGFSVKRLAEDLGRF